MNIFFSFYAFCDLWKISLLNSDKNISHFLNKMFKFCLFNI